MANDVRALRVGQALDPAQPRVRIQERAPAAAQPAIPAAERRIAVVRLIILFALLPLLWWDVISPESEMVLTGLTALLVVYILGTLFVLPRLQLTLRHDLFLSIDILAAAAMVFFTGGVQSSLLFLLYIPMLAGALRLDLRQTFFSSVAVSAIVVWMWSVAEGGLPSLGSTAVRVSLFAVGSFLVALFFGQLAQETRLSQARERAHADLTLAYDATLGGWSRALDLRDRETEGHTQRVTEVTLRLAKAMGVKAEALEHIRRGAMLHDIGKIAISDRILLKPGPLTAEETQIMRRHPAYAYDLLSPIAYLRPSLDIPYCHHERWDGSGYPRGLQGEQIPLAARIFAVVDVWDALCSERPYRAAWSGQEAIEYILEQAEKGFDPRVVEAFLELDLDVTRS